MYTSHCILRLDKKNHKMFGMWSYHDSLSEALSEARFQLNLCVTSCTLVMDMAGERDWYQVSGQNVKQFHF